MTDRAIQIIEALRRKYPDLIFKWENDTWPQMDDSFCTLSVALKTNPDNKKSMDFEKGIANHTIAEHVDGFDHVIALLKK